jgi:hypothetical protein
MKALIPDDKHVPLEEFTLDGGPIFTLQDQIGEDK